MELIKNREVAGEGIRIDQLTSVAHTHLMTNLKRYGNELSSQHEAALHNLLSNYSLICTKPQSYTGRFGYALSVGAGKTQSIISFCYALTQLSTCRNISLLVSQPKVEALAELKRNLIANGVPADDIALIHSYSYNASHAKDVLAGECTLKDNHATEPSTEGDLKNYRFLLVTHERLRSSTDIETYNNYQDNQRNLVIYDESFFHSHATAVAASAIKFNVAGANTLESKDDKFREALDYIDECIAVVKARDEDIVFPDKTADVLETYKRSISGRLKASQAEPLVEFLDVCQENVRVVYTSQGEGVITFDIVLPSALDRVVVLDASFNIRELERLDKSLKVAEGYSQVKRFDNVEVTQIIDYRSGRYSIDKNLKVKSNLTIELMDHVASYPENEATIFWTFKPKRFTKRSDIGANVIKKALENRGIDPEQMIEVDGVMRNRFVFETFGNETNTSTYSYCTNTVFAGVLRRSHLDLASCIAGQSEDINADISSKQLKRIELSEMAHVVYQAAGRSRMRVTDCNGQAAFSRVLLVGVEDYSKYMTEAMSGVKWKRVRSVKEDNKYTSKEIAEKIADYLDEADIESISMIKLKNELALTKVPTMTFSRARDLAIEGSAYHLQGRSLVRMFSAA